ncbi:MAG: hypothetical protein ACTSRZ_18975 [Promethearchaeota archaeon]
MKNYEEFYKNHRIQLDSKLFYLSAGLQPKFLFVKKLKPHNLAKNSNNNFSHQFPYDLITFTSEKYMMGGTYFWESSQINNNLIQTLNTSNYSKFYKNQIIPYIRNNNKKLPIFKPPIKLNIGRIYKCEFNLKDSQFDENVFLNFNGEFPQILIRKNKFIFEEDEFLSEKFGIGLLNSNLGLYNIVKISIKDLNHNGLPDVIFGDNDWSEYFPDGKRWGDPEYKPFDENNNYRGGKLHGRLYVMINLGEDEKEDNAFKFTNPIRIKNIDQYGFCSFAISDFTNSKREDIICGNFIHDIHYFKIEDYDENNISIVRKPHLIKKMPGVINYVDSIDFNQNGLVDLIISSENGHIYFLENTGKLNKEEVPIFKDPIPLMQLNPPLKSDVLAIPTAANFNYEQTYILCGNAGGYFDLFYNFPAPKFIRRLTEIPRILPPYPQGSIQGPSEIGWGYVCPVFFDWNNNGLKDIIFSDINGFHYVCLQTSEKKINPKVNLEDMSPKFDKPVKLIDASSKEPLKTVWRVRPALWKNSTGDLNKTGDIYYICLDEDAKLSAYKKVGDFELKKISLVKTVDDVEITFTNKFGGARGRIKLCIYDWTQNGLPDIIAGLPANHNFNQIYKKNKFLHFFGATIVIFENTIRTPNPTKKNNSMMSEKKNIENKNMNISDFSQFRFKPPRYLIHKSLKKPLYFGHHSCAPEIIQKDSNYFLLVGAENGQMYYFKRDEFAL